MFELLRKKIEEIAPISDSEFEFSQSLFSPKKLRRKRYLLGDGDVCRHLAFVEKGTLRSYVIDDKGIDHVLQFSIEGWWADDLASFISEKPANLNIQAIEDSELLLISKPSWELLLEKIPNLHKFFRVLLENGLIATQRRLISTFSDTAEVRYLKFMDAYPEIFQRVPQHMIASYLGITRETLSRVRGQLAARR